MPSVSKAQQRFMGLVHAYKKGEVPASKVSQAVKDAAKSMKKKSTKKFASTKHDDLPNKVRSENMNEDGHTDVASAERKLKLIMKDAMDTLNALRGLSNEDSLPSWWTDKITLAKDYVGKSRDYIMNPAESVNERISVSDERHFGKKGIIIMIDDNGKKVSAIFKDKKNAKGFNRNKPSDIKKLLQLAKKTKYPKAIDESIDEKKNPKREKLKKDFNKRLLALEKQVRRVKQFAKSNDWGRVSAFVEDGLVNDIEDLARYTSEISTLPVDESINEESKTIKSIQNLADKNKYGTVSGTRMNGKTAKEIIAIYNHPKMKSFRGKMDKLKSHELMDLTIRLPKMLGIKVESVNEGKGVEKILKMASEKSFGKIAGRTVDGMTAGLFKAVYDKAPQNSKDKIDKMSEKQLYVFMGKLWNKFGRQVKLS